MILLKIISFFLEPPVDTIQVLFGCGDILAQQAVDRKGFDKHDVARTVRMAAYGGGMATSKTGLNFRTP